MQNKKSAKDIAFDKERVKYRSEIKEANNKTKKVEEELRILKEENERKDTVIRQQADWIERLLEYTSLSEDEMKSIIEKDKKMADLATEMKGLSNIFEILNRCFY